MEQRIDVRVAKRDEGLMVNDFGIIDERSVYTGSSFLLTSFKDAPKFGNYLIFRDQGALSEQYEAEFRRLFEQRYYK
jgi:hypothetical protein